MIRVRLTLSVLAGFLLIQWACVAAQDAGAGRPTSNSGGTARAKSATRELAAVISPTGDDAALTRNARMLVKKAGGDRISTRIYLAQSIDPTGDFRFDEDAVRNHIARRAPETSEGCLFVVDLEGEYFKALRSTDDEAVAKAVDLYVQALRTAREARPGEPVMVYGIPNRTWARFDLTALKPIFENVDYINVNAYPGMERTDARYQRRVDANVEISKKIADQYGLELVAHVNPRYVNGERVPMDAFIKGMEHLKSKGVQHVVYWQPPWKRVEDLALDGKPLGMSESAWQSAVEQCYLCALLKVFDPENPVSKSCSTELPKASSRTVGADPSR